MRARLGIDKTKSWADWAEEEAEEAATLTKTIKAATTQQFKPPLLLSMRLRGGAAEGESGQESGEESGDEGGRDADAFEGESDASGDGSGDESADEDASDVDSSGNVDGLINDAEEEEVEAEEEDDDDEEEEETMEEEAAVEEELDPSGILPTGTARAGRSRKPDWYRDENHAKLMLADVPAHEREAAIDGDDVEEAEGEEDADEDASQSGDETDDESQDEASGRDDDDDDDSDDESQAASITSADNEARCETSGRDEAEALLGMPLTSLKIMRLEAQRARDVVDGKKTLELTSRSCHERGYVLIGETADGARAKGSVIGAVILGECASMDRERYEATTERHHALDFAPAQAWLEKDTLYAQVRAPQPHAPRDSTRRLHGTPPSRPMGPDPHAPRRS